HVVLGEDGPLRKRVEVLNANTTVLPFPAEIAKLGDSAGGRASLLLKLLRSTPSAIQYRDALRAELQELRPQIIHSNGMKMHLLAAMAKPPTSKLIWHIHDYVGARPAMARLLRYFSKEANGAIAVSNSVADDARKALPGVNVTTVLNCVDLDEFSPHGPRLDLDARCGLSPAPEACVRIGLVATMAWWKGHRLFLDAIAKLDCTLPVRGYVVGGSLYQTGSKQESVESLREYANALGLGDRIGFTGFLDEPATAMRALDIVVHASTQAEPFGRVIVEAMACRKAVISSAVGGAAEILAMGDIGETFACGSADSLAQAIETLVGNPLRREELASRSFDVARRHFGRARLQQELLRVYDALHADNAGSAVRILHLHSGNMIGGVESVLQTMADFADTCPELQQDFALAFDGGFAERLRKADATVHLLPEAQLRNPVSVFRSRRKLERLLAHCHFDAVISHSPWCQVVYAPAVRSSHVPLLFWMHGAFDGHWLQKLASRHAPDFAICNSQFTQSTLERVYPRAKSEVLRNPVPPRNSKEYSRDKVRAKLGVPADTTVILMASRMEVWKGHFNLLHAAAELRSQNDWTIWIAGGPQNATETEYFDSLVAETQRLNLSFKVRFLGQRPDVPELMRAADIFCQPNAGPEPFGVVFVEALQAGVPVVTFSMGGPREILDETCGILVPPGEVKMLAAQLSGLIDNPKVRMRLGAAGPSRAKFLCDPAQQLNRLEQLVRSIVAKEKAKKKGTSA
ncbi:MAG TPA: glycosyltransferase family 4 protein, partial [Terriglobales bacterium]|nr:glycosyltransferase family 4 protein [Terriglobales bacterium]